MKHRILTALGVLAAIAGLASSVHAEPTVASNSRTGGFTLSGESLVGINNRTIGADFNRFFLENSSVPTLSNSSTTTVNSAGSDNNLNAQQTGILQLSDNVQVITNDSLSSPLSLYPGRQHAPLPNVERVQVQLGVE